MKFGDPVSLAAPSGMYPLFVRVGDLLPSPGPEIIVGSMVIDFENAGLEMDSAVQVFATDGNGSVLTTPAWIWQGSDEYPTVDQNTQSRRELSGVELIDLDGNTKLDLVVGMRERILWKFQGESSLNDGGNIPVADRVNAMAVGNFGQGAPFDLFYTYDDSSLGWQGTYALAASSMPYGLSDQTPPWSGDLPGRGSVSAVADVDLKFGQDVVVLASPDDQSTPVATYSLLLRTNATGNALFDIQQGAAKVAGVEEIEIFDVDGSAYPDLMITVSGMEPTNPLDPNSWGGTGSVEGVSLALNDGTGNFPTSTLIPVHDRAAGLTSGDFDCDGVRDLVVGDFYGNLYFLRGNGTSFEAASLITTLNGASYRIESGDFDNDGRLDLAVVSALGGNTFVVMQNG